MKLRIENIGRISEGQIEPKDLTLLIGKNNSGKTYAATTLWAFLKNIDDFCRQEENEVTPRLKKFAKDVMYGNKREVQLTIPLDECFEIKGRVEGSFTRNSRDILRKAIGYDGFDRSVVRVTDEIIDPIELIAFVNRREASSDDYLALDREDEEVRKHHPQRGKVLDISLNLKIGPFNEEILSFEDIEADILDDIIMFWLRRSVAGVACCGKDWLDMRNVIYLPAARTGIMLALDYFVSGMLDRSKLEVEELEETGYLPGPIQDFARTLSRPTFTPRSESKNAGILKKLLQGKFSRRRRAGVQYLYAQDELEKEIPLASTSSLVTELAALSVLSGRVGKHTLLIFEEPEAHLHLAAQREMARALARIVNSGVRVLITTHSDTFIQQINNLISLYHLQANGGLLPDVKIAEDEMIRPGSVSAFDFKSINGRTLIEELEISPRGVIAESLNKVLLDLAYETMAISDALEE